MGRFAGLLVGVAVGLSACSEPRQVASDPPAQSAPRAELEARPAGNPLNNAYFGDLHVHTKVSVDSFLRKNMLTMEDAYRFAHGDEVTVAGGEKARLTIPLDFLALTDHSESFHTWNLCIDGSGPAANTPDCLALKKGDNSLQILFQGEGGPRQPRSCPGGTVEGCREAAKKTWRHVQELAERENKPGKFTAFIGYEYSGTLPGSGATGGHLHRNVIFRNSTVPDEARSSLDARRNIELWKWLDGACIGKCDVVAIPHNSNLSWGMSFALETQDHTPYATEDWKRRAKYERLAEIFQIKGQSECGIGFGTSDEQCGFESLPYPPCSADKRAMCYGDGSFVRGALKSGLKLETLLGFNPFKLGFVADTDTHNAIPGNTRENGYVGSIGLADGSPERRLGAQIGRNPGGLTGIWAPENTRDALFDAMKRRETFGTSGTRMRVRLFGGWNFPSGLVQAPDIIAQGYKLGVPMGGDLKPLSGAAPSFLVWAAYDPESARLQKIQVVKGWYDGKNSGEEIYDVVCSDGLTPDPKSHRCPSNGANVDLKDCSITKGKGADELKGVWRDPDFDPKRPAFYYLRVFENPTCRWSAYDAIRLKRPVPPTPSPIQQERAWSSPIWYTPAR